MSEEIKDNKVDTSKLLADLKKKADLLGIKYNANIGFDKLKNKVDMFLKEEEDKEVPVNENSIGPNNNIVEAEKTARKPLYVIIKDLDPSQQNDPTIVKNIGNKYFKIGAIVEKNKPQLVPTAIVRAIEADTMVEWVDQKHAITKRPTGNKVAKTTKRYSIQILDDNPNIEDYE